MNKNEWFLFNKIQTVDWQFIHWIFDLFELLFRFNYYVRVYVTNFEYSYESIRCFTLNWIVFPIRFIILLFLHFYCLIFVVDDGENFMTTILSIACADINVPCFLPLLPFLGSSFIVAVHRYYTGDPVSILFRIRQLSYSLDTCVCREFFLRVRVPVLLTVCHTCGDWK